MNKVMSADVIASIANDAMKLPTGSVIIVDDFHIAEAASAREMTDLVERWPAETAQLVLSSRFDPQLRRTAICAARGQIRDALATVEAARQVLTGTGSVLLARADELEAMLRLSLGDLRSPPSSPVRSAQPGTSRPGRIVTEPLTPAERRVLELQAPWLAPPAEWPEEASVSTAEAEARPIRSLIPARLHRLGWSPFRTRMVAGLVGGGMPSRGWCRGSWPSRRCR